MLRHGATHTVLRWSSDDAPQVYVQRDATIHGSLSGAFLPNDQIDFSLDELQPVMILNGQEHPMGVFLPATMKQQMTETGIRLDIEAYDRCWRVYNNKTDHVLHLAAGKGYIDVICELLADCGIVLILADTNSATLQTDREDWPIGTSYLTICNQLLKEINYDTIWFDALGVCHLNPYQTPNASQIKWKYGSNPRSQHICLISQECESEVDIFDAPNVFIVTCSNPDLDEAMVAKSVNDSPLSTKSVLRRGLKIVSSVSVKNIASQDELQAYADRLRNESMMSTQIISFSSLAEPDHGVGDILAISTDQLEGIYQETGWQQLLAPGELMLHTAQRTVIV